MIIDDLTTFLVDYLITVLISIFYIVEHVRPLVFGTSTSRTSQIDSTPSDTECTPNKIFFFTHWGQCQIPGRAPVIGGSRQDRW